MADCTHHELIERVTSLEASLKAFREIMDERDERYKLRAITQDSAVAAALQTSDKALVKAETATEKRFEGVNEFRATLADQAAMLMPRAEYAVQHQALIDKVDLNETRINQLSEQISGILARSGGARELWGYLVGIVGVVLAALAIYFHNGH